MFVVNLRNIKFWQILRYDEAAWAATLHAYISHLSIFVISLVNCLVLFGTSSIQFPLSFYIQLMYGKVHCTTMKWYILPIRIIMHFKNNTGT